MACEELLPCLRQHHLLLPPLLTGKSVRVGSSFAPGLSIMSKLVTAVARDTGRVPFPPAASRAAPTG